MKLHLLSDPTTNTKLEKSEEFGYLTFGLSLAPHNVSGYMTCPHASNGCIDACIFTAGRGKMPNVSEARIRKTQLLFENKELFIRQLRLDIESAVNYSSKRNMKAAFRLNVFSDIRWEHYGIIQEFSDQTFYDYTKNPQRMLKFCYGLLPANYHLTFSRSETNSTDVVQVMRAGGNVAAVFGDELPAHWMGRPVIDGDEHDLRFLDPTGCIVGLAVKGEGKKDQTGFVL